MDNKTNTDEAMTQVPVETENTTPETIPRELPTEEEAAVQEPLVLDEKTPQPEPEVSEAEIPVVEPETSVPSNEYQQVLNQYAADTQQPPVVEDSSQEKSTRSSEEQLQDLGISPPPKEGSGVFKILFIISLIIFIIVFAGLAWTYLKNQKQDSSSKPIESTPTPVGTCFLNDVTYHINQSFLTADGCNTCTCTSQDLLSCTDNECVLPSPTASITPSKTVTPTITPEPDN